MNSLIFCPFHLQRWGKPCYAGENLLFIQKIFDALYADGKFVDLSVLSLNDKPISAVLDIHYGSRIYNFFSVWFCPETSKNISLGIIHFGYQIESACNNPMIDYYDFMAGAGKQVDYNQSISTNKLEFVTFKK